MTHLVTRIGSIELKNPVICGAGEHTMTPAGIRSALAAGAAAVVAKSTNESAAAKAQLDKTDYALFDSQWRRLPWNFAPPADASLFCRSGLTQTAFEPWLDDIAALDGEARKSGAYVIPSLILSDLSRCVERAIQIEQRGLRVLELNIGAPHGEEAARGAIVLERDVDRIAAIVSTVRAAIRIPLWIKLTGQSENVVALAAAASGAGADAVVMMGRFMGFLPDLDTGAPVLGTSAAIGGGWALPLTARWLMLTRRKLGADVPLIATNGARNGLDVARFLLSGAAATEITTAVFTGGYDTITHAIDELDAYVRRRSKPVAQLVGEAADSVQTYEEQPDRPHYWCNFAPPCG